MSYSKTRIIGRRASSEQKHVLLQYLERNLDFAHFISDTLNGGELLRQEWDDLANTLNKIDGARKIGSSWRKYWLDLREYTKQRIDDINNKDNIEGNLNFKKLKPLSETELRIVNIMNWKHNKLKEKQIPKVEKIPMPKWHCKEKVVIVEDAPSRIRTGRASDLQKQELVKYFEEHPNALRIANNMVDDPKAKQRVWIELTHKLNAIEGVMKPSSKWAKYWNDIVVYTKNRAKRAISGQRHSLNDRVPTDLERRMLKIVGQEHMLQYWEDAATENVKIENSVKITHSEDEDFEWNDFDAEADNPLADQAQPILTIEEHNPKPSTSYETVCYELQDENVDYSEDYYHTEPIEFLNDSNKIENSSTLCEQDIQQIVTIASSTDDVLSQCKKRKCASLDKDSDDNDVEDDDLAAAVFALGTAASSLATALNGLANVLKKRKRKQ